LVEAAEQLSLALAQLATLPSTPALRAEQIRLQVALITPLIHVKGYAAPETKAAEEQARRLIEQAEALGEPLEEPLLLFSVLYGFWIANLVAFNGDNLRKLAAHFMELAEKQKGIVPTMIGHRVMGISLLATGDIAASRAQFDRAVALYNPVEHRPFASMFGLDNRVSVLIYRARAHWYLGYPDAALVDAERAFADAREIGQAATLMNALFVGSWPYIFCGKYSAANARLDQVHALAHEKGSMFWRPVATLARGCISALTGQASEAVETITSGLSAFRATGATLFEPLHMSHLAKAFADLGRVEEATCCIDQATAAMEASRERWDEAEINRMAGEVALIASDAAKAETHFNCALAIARAQQAKSWELRAAMSMARLWLARGKQDEARKLLAPIYGWFTEGFDTLDLKEARDLLDVL